MRKSINWTFSRLLSDKTKSRIERSILSVAIASYFLHLILIFLVDRNYVVLESDFTSNPIAAIYTPFSFILVYEVYLLIYYLPKSITFYIGKQYEIITLIIIRRIFKDIANIQLSSEWFQIKNDLQFTYDIVASLVLFYLIYIFYGQFKRKAAKSTSTDKDNKIQNFILLKRGIAVVLVPLLLAMAVFSFYDWFLDAVYNYEYNLEGLKNINNIFFDDFFTVLIIVDVFLLLSSFYYSDRFHKIIRNSGFVISTILIKTSFSVDGLVNIILIIGSVVFGLLMLFIHNQYEKRQVEVIN